MAGGRQLLIRYGLGKEPSDLQSAQWARRSREIANTGVDLPAAAERAAQELFPDYRTRVYAAEADNIEVLLRLAENK